MGEIDDFRDYPASAEDLTKVAALLAGHGVPARPQMAQIALGSLAKYGVKFVVARADGSEVTLTLAEVIRVLGHDL
jgi:hypothetical protein